MFFGSSKWGGGSGQLFYVLVFCEVCWFFLKFVTYKRGCSLKEGLLGSFLKSRIRQTGHWLLRTLELDHKRSGGHFRTNERRGFVRLLVGTEQRISRED